MSFSHNRARRAFTLVELLVVIAIIGVMVGLLLPAVQAAREAARRSQCSNNLRQIGLGLHNYEATYRRLPSGWIANTPDGEPGWSWAVALLPYLEQDNIMQEINVGLPIEDDVHANVRTYVIPTFICPSDTGKNVFRMAKGDGHHDHDHGFATNVDLGEYLFSMSKSNYAGVFGTMELEDDPYNGDGTFYGNSRTKFRDIVDGLSNTIIVGERSSRLGGSIWHGVIPEATEPESRIVGVVDHTPNNPIGHFEDFSSYHAVGAHFIMGDCSVRMISDNVDENVYKAMATRAGDEVISADQ